MNINRYKRGAAAVIAVALLAASFAGCDQESKTEQPQTSESTSQTASVESKTDSTESNNDTVETADDAAEFFDDESDSFEDVFTSESELITEGDFSYYVIGDDAYIESYNGSEETVTIPEKLGGYPVKSLNFFIFSYNDDVKKVIIPDTVESVESDAYECAIEVVEVSKDNKNFSAVDGVLFDKDKTKLLYYPAEKLGDYKIPDTVESVGENSFSGCKDLGILTLSKNIQNIDGDAFNGCNNLTEFKLSGENSDFSVKDGVLYNKDATKLVSYPSGKKGSFKMPDTVETVVLGAFSGAENLEKVELSKNLTEIESNAFLDCINLKEVKFNDKLKTIGESAFSACESLSEIKLPKSLTSIGSYAFSNCTSLEEVNIPQNVSKLYAESFAYCQSLKTVTADKNNKHFTVQENVLYDKEITKIILYPLCREGDYKIPEGIETIGSDTFYQCDNITKLTVPSTVTSIEAFALDFCYSIKTIEVDSANKNYSAEDGVLFNKDKTELVKFPAAKKGEYTVPDSVKTIDDFAFYMCSEVTSVTIPEGVESLSYESFDSSGIEKIYIPKSVKSIGATAFDMCENLTDVYYAGSESDWKKIGIDEINDSINSDDVKIHYNSKY